mmetsp:Transcript_80510/g.231120  ORF Transcript_80510/g.231120 Transcript_80510/m.231120 type:complete len:262 (+) Transcript_80510:707-1492(+)
MRPRPRAAAPASPCRRRAPRRCAGRRRGPPHGPPSAAALWASSARPRRPSASWAPPGAVPAWRGRKAAKRGLLLRGPAVSKLPPSGPRFWTGPTATPPRRRPEDQPGERSRSGSRSPCPRAGAGRRGGQAAPSTSASPAAAATAAVPPGRARRRRRGRHRGTPTHHPSPRALLQQLPRSATSYPTTALPAAYTQCRRATSCGSRCSRPGLRAGSLRLRLERSRRRGLISRTPGPTPGARRWQADPRRRSAGAPRRVGRSHP